MEILNKILAITQQIFMVIVCYVDYAGISFRCQKEIKMDAVS